MKQLPIGVQIFETVRRKNGVYVDKTAMIYELVSGISSQYFLSRPRRFGKSFTCWTLDALFSGKRELFEGLAISKTDWEWESYPVIRLDMSKVETNKGLDGVKKTLDEMMVFKAKELEVDVDSSSSAGSMLEQMLVSLSKKHGKPAVVIIDEYDCPFLEFCDKPQMAREVRDIMRSYYSRLKSNEQYIRFLFMTGISKFTKAGIFSRLNNLNDISLDRKFGTFLGYTEAELVENFSEHLEAGAAELKCSVDELVERMRRYYNGYCFDGRQRVYNPISVLNFFKEYDFANYWMESGSSKFVADYMRDRNLTVEQFIGMRVSLDFASNPGEIEDAAPESFLYQGGYLTLREGDSDGFLLDYPNTEVLNSMSRLVCDNIMRRRGDSGAWDISSPSLDALRDGNCELLVKMLNHLLSCVPYDDYARSAQSAISRSGLPAGEWLYRSNILTFLRGCGVMAMGEPHTSVGRPDLLVCYRGSAWVIEIKVAYDGDDGKALAQEALAQITAGQYAAPYKTAKKVGMSIDDKTRQITDWCAAP